VSSDDDEGSDDDDKSKQWHANLHLKMISDSGGLGNEVTPVWLL
jgi:hypothetical protein